MVCSEVTKYLSYVLIRNDCIMSDRADVFRNEESFAICQSALHEVWARAYSSRLETRLKYSIGNAFETFPFPVHPHSDALERGRHLHQLRAALMVKDRIGLTKIYNRFHAEIERDPRIEGLRALQREMDTAVAHAYGWDDLDLQHGFHEVPYLPENDRVRYTISEAARVEVLRRLSELNRQRYEEEVTQGLHGNTTPCAPTPKRRCANTDVPQPSLDLDLLPANEGHYLKIAEPRLDYCASPAHAIAEHLKAHPGRHAKSDILAAIGIADGQWNTAINELLASGKVERQGERRGARYCLATDFKNQGDKR